MEIGNMTKSVQSLPAEVVSRLPDEALVVLTTDVKADCRPRLYVHNRGISPVAYVLKYRYCDGKRMKRRSVYLGPLRSIEVEQLRLGLEAMHLPGFASMFDCTRAECERDIKATQAWLKVMLREATEHAERCGFRFKGRRIHRVGATGLQVDRQYRVVFGYEQRAAAVRDLRQFNVALFALLEAAQNVAAQVMILIATLSARAKERSADAPPHSRLARYERTLAGLYRYRDMVDEAGQRIRRELEPPKTLRAA